MGSRRFVVILATFALAACGGGGGGGGGSAVPAPGGGGGEIPLVLVAGMLPVAPAADASWSEGMDLSPFGVVEVGAAYDLTTPPGEAFAFDLLSRSASNAGAVRVSLAHVSDGGAPTAGGAESLADAGIVPSAAGASSRGPWLDILGDGFARITLHGAIDRDQVFAVQADSGSEAGTALVRLRVGARSPINVPAGPQADYPGVEEERTVYSSDSWMFGLPTIAVSGDRTSIVTYEGDRADPHSSSRYEMRIQYDHASGEVTGGGSAETSLDTGHWRDHEIAALYNVLALVHCGDGAVTVRLSFDRGASFEQTEILGGGSTGYFPRLVQCAMAGDYTLAILFWRANPDRTTDLVLVSGRPLTFDPSGSPTRFEFDPEQIVYHDPGDVVPLLMAGTWSVGGDLAVAYAFTRFTSGPDGTWESVTQNRCAVRLFGGTFSDTLVDEDVIVGKDPSVSVIGSGAGMKIFYAYEGRDGVVLRTSDDAGALFGPGVTFGTPAAHTPSVLAREQAGSTRVDLLYLERTDEGTELHLVHWDDHDRTLPTSHRLTDAKMAPSSSVPPGSPAPGGGPGFAAPDRGFRITEVAWFGYDAVLDGDDVLVVVDEQTYDAFVFLLGAPARSAELGGMGPAAPDFVPADPPPLAPGLTEPVPPPDPDDMHQLRWLRLD